MTHVTPEATGKFKQLILNLLNKLKNVFSKQKNRFVDIQHIENEFVKVCDSAQKAWEQKNTPKNEKSTAEGARQYSIRKDIVDVNGKEYETVVELDKIASKRVLSEPKRLLNYIKANFVGLKIPVEDNNGNTEIIEFAAENETVTKNGNNHPVLRELAHTKGETRRKVIINAKEVIEESVYDPSYSSTDNDHGWLDKNGWESRKTYVLQDGVIYETYLKIAKAADGRNILYAVNLDINNGIAVDQGATQKRAAILSAMPSDNRVAQKEPSVNSNSTQKSKDSTQKSKDYSESGQYSVGLTDTEELDTMAVADELISKYGESTKSKKTIADELDDIFYSMVNSQYSDGYATAQSIAESFNGADVAKVTNEIYDKVAKAHEKAVKYASERVANGRAG